MANREKASTRKKSGSAKQRSPARRSGPVKKSAAARRSGPVKKSSAAARAKVPAKRGSAARGSRPVKKSTAARQATAAKKGTAAKTATAARKRGPAKGARAAGATGRGRTGLATSRPAASELSAALRAVPEGEKAKKSQVRQIQDAVDRARDWLGARGDYYTFLSRQDTIRGAPELGRHLRGDLLAKQGRDGSWGNGSLVASAEAIWQLLDMGTSPDFQPFARGLDWLYAQLDADGSFASGCTPARHEQGTCEHFLRGFFSPARADQSVEVTLPNGESTSSDTAARLLASERALRSALRAGPGDPRLVGALTGLISLPLYEEYDGAFTPAVLVGAIQALAWSPSLAAEERAVGLATLAAAQEPDGSWPSVEFFFVLETLLEARHPLVAGMLKRAVPRLIETLHRDGTWGKRHAAPQTWIAVQVLERTVLHDPGGKFGSD